MTNKQIIKKAIEKAVKNGWKIGSDKIDVEEYKDSAGNTVLLITINKGIGNYNRVIEEIIFSHDFAEKFWGEKPTMVCEWGKKKEMNRWGGEFPLWIYHLFQMVKEKEPLKYLEKFL